MTSIFAFGVWAVCAQDFEKPSSFLVDTATGHMLLGVTADCAQTHFDFVTANGTEPDDPKIHQQNITGCVSTGLRALYNNINDLKGIASQKRVSLNVRTEQSGGRVGAGDQQEDGQDQEDESLTPIEINFNAWLDVANWDDFELSTTLMDEGELEDFFELLQNPPPVVQDITDAAEVQAVSNAFKTFFFHLDELWATIMRFHFDENAIDANNDTVPDYAGQIWEALEPQLLRSRINYAAGHRNCTLFPESCPSSGLTAPGHADDDPPQIEIVYVQETDRTKDWTFG